MSRFTDLIKNLFDAPTQSRKDFLKLSGRALAGGGYRRPTDDPRPGGNAKYAVRR